MMGSVTGRTRWLFTLACALVCMVMLGCGSPPCSYDRLLAPSIAASDPLPACHGPVVLTLKGKDVPGGSAHLDMSVLESLGTVGYEVSDPWLKCSAYYSGVLLADLVGHFTDIEGVDTICAVGIDGYTAIIEQQALAEWPILIATRMDGARLSLQSGGPTRIILPYSRYPNIADARAISAWNLETLQIQ